MVWCPRSKLCYYVLFFSLRKQRVQFSNGKAGEKIWSIWQSSGKFGRSYPNRRPMVWLPNTCATKKIYRSNPQFLAMATTFSSLPSNTWIWAWVCHLHFIASPPILPSILSSENGGFSCFEDASLRMNNRYLLYPVLKVSAPQTFHSLVFVSSLKVYCSFSFLSSMWFSEQPL